TATKLPHGIINKLATEWGVSRHTIQRIWRETLKQYRAGSAIGLHTKKARRGGRKRYTLQTSQLTEVPLRQRTTLRSLASALNISKSTVHRMVKRGEIKSYSNLMKPQLTFTHKYERVKNGVFNQSFPKPYTQYLIFIYYKMLFMLTRNGF
ncbi:Homeobox-leucine zipper protein HDG5, partial [Bienertia sinuspersici]